MHLTLPELSFILGSMIDEMITGKLRPRFREIAEARDMPKMTISRVSGIPYQTVQSYYNSGQELSAVRLTTLYAYLRGVGYSNSEILDLRLGDLFDIVEGEDVEQ